ncbi:response regulator [Agitococcus lubricus]|uniref:EAL domain-containing protein (Putative c-di-GMP-specific phosphodiesterase class I) n=1 Tax=Agitococcus lubricus TaxID=1077255 RepID=A0A2T5J429_9GAMM|nr:response regulator [Agitococcus lubricus]PTQ91364.1 EAL domain-containing protein (putative c-di-GMP-specific phosphodiesterase class I) [Agitococcus lubricus]
MSERQARLEERIRSVQRNFIAALPNLMADISDRWNTLRHTGWERAIVLELQSIVHRLAGSGGTFGFPDISRTAATLDVALGQTLADAEYVAPETKLSLDTQVDDLLSVLKAALVSQDDAGSEPPLLTSMVVGGQKLVVMIEDDDLLRERLSALLESAGYRVVGFAAPALATGFLQEEQPALVLLDLMFPGQRWPAFEVINDIRGETGERTPVAVMSGHVDFRSRLDATRAGADAYIVKPINETQLLEVVAQLANRRLDDSWRCLVIDDDTLLSDHIVAWLTDAGMIAQSVTSARDSWLKVREFKPDVLVLDINMPECNGIELATMLRQDANTSQLPIVFLTSDTGERTRRHAMAAGADDYLLKPISRSALVQAVVARARLGKRMQGQVARVTQQAPQGYGLSRHYFFTELERALDEADGGSVQAALVLIALTEMSKVSEQHGALGLAALQEQLFTRLTKLNVDTWSMIGENTIAFLLPRDTIVAHKNYISHILEKLSVQPFEFGQHTMPATAAAANLQLRQPQAISSVLLQAEQMLGLALDGGAGTIIDGFVGTSNSVDANSGRLAVSRLRAVYQPIITIGDNENPINMVLARLSDTDGNLLPAGRFLSALEKRGWLPDLDTWVFQHAHKLLTQETAIEDSLNLVIHVSPQSLSNAIYMTTVLTLLHDHPMPSDKQRLIMAIAESTLITHRNMVNQLQQAMTTAGASMMITQYGASGHSVSLLQQIKPAFVRLDENLSRRLEQSDYLAADRVLIEAAEAENAIIVASGIETASSLSGLWSKGIRWFQGYFVHEPAPTPTTISTL